MEEYKKNWAKGNKTSILRKVEDVFNLRQIEYNLTFKSKMEDNLNLRKIVDKLNFKVNGRQPQCLFKL